LNPAGGPFDFDIAGDGGLNRRTGRGMRDGVGHLLERRHVDVADQRILGAQCVVQHGLRGVAPEALPPAVARWR
jgi:hypothetical protein